MAIIRGTDVTNDKILQSAIYQAIHGNMHVAKVKNMAIDIFATNVRHLGPTYSSTITNKYYLLLFLIFIKNQHFIILNADILFIVKNIVKYITPRLNMYKYTYKKNHN